MGFAHTPKLISSTATSFTMEKIEGPSLRGHQPIEEDLFLHVLDVVQALHACGFAHGNLRANNILIAGSGEPFLIDFETCCEKSNPFFFAVKFSDHMRLYSLWKSRVTPIHKDQTIAAFPKSVIVVMLLAAPLAGAIHGVRSIRRMLKHHHPALDAGPIPLSAPEKITIPREHIPVHR